MRTIYTDDRLIALIREALGRAYDIQRRQSGNAASWPSLSRSIERRSVHVTEADLRSLPDGIDRERLRAVDFGMDTLRKFAVGVRQRDGSLKSEVPDTDEKLAALELWLADPANKFSTLTRTDLRRLSRLSDVLLHAADAAKYLGSLFHDKGMDVPCVAAEHLAGTYVGERVRKGTNQRFTLMLDSYDKHTLEANLEELLTRSDEASRDPSSKRLCYAGWALATPEDNVLLHVRNSETNRNSLFLTLGIDTEFYSTNRVRHLVLFDTTEPLELVDPDAEGELARIRSEWGDRVFANSLIFRRQ